MKTIGYARVSTIGQSLDAQREQLANHGCDRVVEETASGSQARNRPVLQCALKELTAGDRLVVTRLDRLARSSFDLLNILDSIGKAGASFQSLAEPWADTASPSGRLMITVLGGLAEFERSLIAERTKEGRSRARAAGQKMGRPYKLTRHQRRQAVIMRQDGMTCAEVARLLNVSAATVARIKVAD